MAIKYILIEVMTISACCLALAFLEFFFSGEFLSFEIANLLREDERYFYTYLKEQKDLKFELNSASDVN